MESRIVPAPPPEPTLRYEPPRLERVVTATEIEREVKYAGEVGQDLG